jgi:Transposase and inactivated derivatives
MKADYPVEVLCEAFCVSRSGYYHWLERRTHPSQRQREDQQLAQRIVEIHQQSRASYGTPRLEAELRVRGHRHSRKRVDRIRRALGLRARPKRRYRPRTTQSDHHQPAAANRLAKLIELTGIDQVWVSDITYIDTDQGWLYLAVVMDLFSRRIVGWAFGDHLGSQLAIGALSMALLHRQAPEGLIHHSDRGVQYASAAYRQLLKGNGIVASMSRKGCCYDNAAMEAFFSTLKRECVYRQRFTTRAQGRREIFSYIEGFYNRRRLHSRLAYRAPVVFEYSAESPAPESQQPPTLEAIFRRKSRSSYSQSEPQTEVKMQTE